MSPTRPKGNVLMSTGVLDYIVIIVAGTMIILSIALFIGYLIVRIARKRRLGIEKSKADRPLWIMAALFAAICWISSSLLLYGSIVIVPIANSSQLVIGLKWILQYSFGFVLWFNLVLYRIIRIYLRMTSLRATWQPWSLLLILQAPFLVVAIASTFLQGNAQISPNGWLSQSFTWSGILLVGMLGYMLTFIFFTIKVCRVMEKYHELYRYVIFCSTSLVFPLYDCLVLFATNTEGINVEQVRDTPAVSTAVIFVQLTVLLVCLIVAGNLGHVYFLVLRKKQVKFSKTNFALTTFGSIDVDDDDGSSDIKNLEEGQIETIVRTTNDDILNPDLDGAEVDFKNIPELNNPSHFILSKRPRRTLHEKSAVDFDGFVRRMPLEAFSQIDHNAAYFSYKNRPTPGLISTNDLETCQGYLSEEP